MNLLFKNTTNCIIYLFLCLTTASLTLGQDLSIFTSNTLTVGQGYSYVDDIAVVGQNVMVLCSNKGLIAVDSRTGSLLWQKPGDQPAVASSGEGKFFSACKAGSGISVSRLSLSGVSSWNVDVSGNSNSNVTLGGLEARGDLVFVLINTVKVNTPDRTTYSTACTALSSETGAIAWRTELGLPGSNSDLGNSLFASGESRLFAGVSVDFIAQKENATVFCLDSQSGEINWFDSYNGIGNGSDKIVSGGLAVDQDGSLITLVTSDGSDQIPDLVVRKINEAGISLWTTRYGGRDQAVTPSGIIADSQGNIYVAATVGTIFQDKKIFVAKYNGENGALSWSGTWKPNTGGPSGAKDIVLGDNSLFVAGWAGDCSMFACLRPAVLELELQTGNLKQSFVDGNTASQLMTCVYSSPGFLAAAGIYYGEDIFSGEPEIILFGNPAGDYFIRGDVNGDLKLTIADPIQIFGYLFKGETISCLDAADLNDDGAIDIADPIVSLNYLFKQGLQPEPPFPGCGYDETPDSITCEMPPECR